LQLVATAGFNDLRGDRRPSSEGHHSRDIGSFAQAPRAVSASIAFTISTFSRPHSPGRDSIYLIRRDPSSAASACKETNFAGRDDLLGEQVERLLM
jgi:hypothetical protein